MGFQERGIWIDAAVTLCSFVAYAALVLARAQGVPLDRVAYVAPMLWVIGAGIVAIIAGRIATGIGWPEDCGKTDVRDLEIGRFGDRVGQSFLGLSGLAALGLCMAEASHFWIANVIYLGFVVSVLMGAAMKLAAYRQGIPEL